MQPAINFFRRFRMIESIEGASFKVVQPIFNETDPKATLVTTIHEVGEKTYVNIWETHLNETIQHFEVEFPAKFNQTHALAHTQLELHRKNQRKFYSIMARLGIIALEEARQTRQ